MLMVDPVSDSERLRAEGVPITLKNGATAMVRYGYYELAQLEEEYGDLTVFINRLSLKEWRIRTSLRGLELGLAHQYPDVNVPERPDVTTIRALVDFKRSREYIVAMLQAFTQAMPPFGKGDRKNLPNDKRVGSPSSASTGSRRSITTGRTRSSGG